MTTVDDSGDDHGLMDKLPAPIDALDAGRAFGVVTAKLLGKPRQHASVGRFVLLERVGAGGMGVVYSAFDPQLDRRVAIKVLHPEVAEAQGSDRLIREARSLARLNHPNVVSVFEAGTFEDRVFLAMELVDGTSLSAWMQTRRGWREVLDVALEAGRGVAEAHRLGVVHRDFKPANVMIDDGGRVVVLDFGLAHSELRDEQAETLRLTADDVSAMETQEGAIIGTPAYMAPEQHRGLEATAASDQFSFCVSVYEALYGRRPFGGRTRTELLLEIEAMTLARTDIARVPGVVRRALVRGLHPDPAQRWPSMNALLVVLHRRRHGRRWMFPVMGSGALACGAIGAASLLGAEGPVPCERVAAAMELTWNDGVSEQTVAALSAIEHAQSGEIAAGVGREVDRYVAGWTQARTDACEAERANKPHGGACLDGQRQWLETSLELLRAPDLHVLRSAASLIPHTDDLNRCTVEAPRAAMPTFASATERAALEQDAAKALALGRTGEFDAAMAIADGHHRAALAADDHGAVARSLQLKGLLHRLAGDHAAAITAFEGAVLSAERADDAVARLDTQRGFALEMIELGKLDEAERVLRRVEAAHERFEPLPWHWEAEINRLRARLYEERGDGPRALEAVDASVKIVREHANADEGAVVSERLFQARLRLLFSPGPERLPEIEALHAEILRERGPLHSDTAGGWGLLFLARYKARDLPGAIEAVREEISVRSQLSGPESIVLLKPRSNLAVIYTQMGAWDDALATFEEVAALTRQHRPMYDRQLAYALNNAAGVHTALEQPQQALPLLREAYAVHCEYVGCEHPSSITMQVDIAATLTQLEKYDEAVDTLNKAIDQSRREHGELAAGVLKGSLQLAKTLDTAVRNDEALRAITAARDVALRAEAPPRLMLSVHLSHTTILLRDASAASTAKADAALAEAEALREAAGLSEADIALLEKKRREITQRQAAHARR